MDPSINHRVSANADKECGSWVLDQIVVQIQSRFNGIIRKERGSDRHRVGVEGDVHRDGLGRWRKIMVRLWEFTVHVHVFG